MPKIMCPYHNDTNPSMELFPDGYGFCFVCWKQYPMDSELIKKSQGKKVKKPKENLAEKLTYISSLPTKEVRGVQVPYNDRGYFIVWPDQSYYKLRQWQDVDPKYIGPSGHQPPLFKLIGKQESTTLVIVEGELNALSLSNVIEHDIISPGAAGHFKVHQSELIEISKNYKKIILWTDNDYAGHEALLSLAPELTTKSNVVGFIHSDQDANELLKQGRNALITKVGTYVEIGEEEG